MTTIMIKVGGCNGSGKTAMVRILVDDIVSTGGEITYIRKKISCYLSKPNAIKGLPPGYRVAVLGSYANVCGGMDTISDKEDRLALIKSAAENLENTFVVFEGLITGKTYGAIGAFSETSDQHGKWVYAFMDTPFDVCVARVMQRRAAKGNDGPFDPERTMRPTFKGCLGASRLAKYAGHMVVMMPHELSPRDLAGLLISHGVTALRKLK